MLRKLEERNFDIFTLPIPGQKREEHPLFPLSFGQERLWFVHQLDPENVAYNITRAIRLHGKFSRDHLKRAIHEIVRRHELLRTRFITVDEKPVQEVLPELSIPLDRVDLREVPGELQDERLQAIILEESRKPFDLVAGPLIRTRLYELGEDDHVFLLVIHHIVSDGVSISLFIRELAAFYQAFGTGDPPPAVELPLQYADYAYWQRQWFCPEAFEAGFGKKLETFWLEQFRDEIPRLPLPTDYPGPQAQSFDGEQWIDWLEMEETRQLKQLVSGRKTTLFITLLSIYYVFLARLSGVDDIVVGTPVTGRRHPALRELIGMFVNMLPLRNRPLAQAPFIQFLDTVRERTLEAFENQEYRYEDIVEKLNPGSDTGSHSIFDVVFSLDLDDLDNVDVNDSGFRWQSYPWYTRTSKFDLGLTALEEGHRIKLTFEYSTALFEAGTIKRYASYFKRIAAAVAGEPRVSIAGIDILPAAERESILYRFNREAPFPADQTVPALFEAHAAASPGLTALVGTAAGGVGAEPGLHQMTYSRLNREAGKVACLLREKGAGPGDIVGIVMGPSITLVAAQLGVLKSGAAYLPIDPLYPDGRIDYMIKDSGTRLILTSENEGARLKGIIAAAGGELVLPGDTGHTVPSDAAVSRPATPPNPGAPMYVIYTSGSTGRSKGVLVRHRGFVNLVWRHREVFGEAPGRQVSQVAGPAFDAMASEVWPCLAGGATLHLAGDEERMDPVAMQRWLIARGITIAFLPTPMAEQVLKLPWPSSGVALRCLRAAGDRLTAYPPPGLPFRLFNAYGPTEDTVWTTWWEVPPRENGEQGTLRRLPQFPPIGQPVANHRVVILDTFGKLQPIGIAGELCAGGAGVAMGYLNRPELTAQRFVWPDAWEQGAGGGEKNEEPWEPSPPADTQYPKPNLRTTWGGPVYRTGDLARWLPDGNIEFLGRLDFQVKIRGFRIEPEEIAHRLLELQDVSQAAVILQKSRDGEHYLSAFLEPKKGCDIQPPQVREQLAQNLPHYMMPSRFTVLQRIPVTPNGKIDRKALAALESGEKDGVPPVEPGNRVERLVLEHWTQVLNRQKAGVMDNFFESGGHSLKAMSLINRIHKTFNIKIPIRLFHQNPTVRALARYISGAGQERYVAVEPVEEREFYPLSAAQRRMFILNQFVDYSIPVITAMEGPIETKAFEDALRGLVRGHESLRTAFKMVGDTPMQQIFPHVDVKLEVYRVAEAELAQRVSQFSHLFEPFDITRPPLLRAALVSLSDRENKHLFIYNIHHLVTDGTTQAILSRDFLRLYSGDHLPPPAIRYRDFVLWEQQWMKGEAFGKLETFWLDQFSGDIPVLELPVDYPRPPVQAYQGGHVRFQIHREDYQAVNRMLMRENVTLYMAMMAVYNTLLFRYSRQEDIVAGSIAAGRQSPELDELAGVFINTLAVRNRPRPGMSFSRFLDDVKTVILSAFEHQSYPFGQLLEKVTLKKDISRSPLFDVMLILQNMERPRLENAPFRLTPFETAEKYFDPEIHAQHDMVLWVFDEPDRIDCLLEYSTSLFREDTMQRLAKHLQNLLVSAPHHPEVPLERMDMMSPAEKRQVLSDFNGAPTAFPPGKTIHGLFKEQARRSPHGIAAVGPSLISGDVPGSTGSNAPGFHEISYRRLDMDSDRLAHRLRAAGIEAGTVVAVMLDRCIEMFTGIMAVLKAGAAFVPIDPALPAERIHYMLADSAAPLLLTSSPFEDTVTTGVQKIFLESCLRDNAPMSTPAATGDLPGATDETGLAYVIYTSGTTGRPKGVLIRHDNYVNAAFAWIKEYRLACMEVRLLQVAGFSFDVSCGDVARGLLSGGRVTICPEDTRVDHEAFYALLRRHRISLFESTPALVFPLMEYLHENRLELPGLRLLIIGSDICRAADFRPLVERYGGKEGQRLRVINSYGVTEAAIDSSYYEACAENLPEKGNVPIGRPLPNVSFYILDVSGNLQPVGVPGELFIGGNGVGHGYLNRPELTAGRFVWLDGLAPASGFNCVLASNKKGKKGDRQEEERAEKEVLTYSGDPGLDVGANFVFAQQEARRSHSNPLKKEQEAVTWTEGPPLSPLSPLPSPLYKTGDLARWLPDGNVEFLGRMDYQVKIRGYRIEIEEIERRLMQHPAVADTAVVDRDDRGSNKFLCAFIVSKTPQGLTPKVKENHPHILTPKKEHTAVTLETQELREHLSGKLPGYMVPAYFLQLDELPATSNGKIDRKALRSYPLSGNLSSGTEYVPPDNETERKLVALWEEILLRERIGIDDSFFELGGQSILAMRLMVEIKRTFNVKISLGVFFQTCTIKKIAQYIVKHQPAPAEAEGNSADYAPASVSFKKRKRRERHI